jgi:hypothetical protein
MTRAAGWVPVLVAALLVAGSRAAVGSESDAPDSAAADPVPDEVRCEELALRWEELAARARESREGDLVLVESEEIARVADELRAEGDAALAATLLEEAIALLQGGEPQS